MSFNTASNFPNLVSLTADFLNTQRVSTTPQNVINTFLFAVSQANYDAMKTELVAAQAALATGANATLRSLICTSDGTVCWDSSKGTNNNTYDNFLAKEINTDNHQSRPEILLAVLGNSGTGQSDRYSTSVSTTQKYNAYRLGDSTNNNTGTFRLSMDDTLS